MYVQQLVEILNRNILLYQMPMMILNVFLVVMIIVVQEDILLVELYLWHHKHE
jgi:hypothetical protein